MSVTTYRTEQTAILARFKAEWVESGVPLTPVAWPNAHFTPTDGVAFVRVFVNRQEAFNVAFTATDKRVRHPGLVTVDIYAPLNKGDREALDLADEACSIFRNVTFSGITFRAPTVRDFGPEDDRYRVQVDCPYWRDSIHAHA